VIFFTGDDASIIHQNIIFYGIGIVLSVIIICGFAIKAELGEKK